MKWVGYVILPLALSFTNRLYAQQLKEDPQNTRSINTLEKHGITFNFDAALEGYFNMKGGKRTGLVAASLFDANTTINLKKLLEWSGGSFYAELEEHA